MEYFDDCYTQEDMDKIIESVVQEYEKDFGEPDKVIRCYYDTREDNLKHLVNQSRIYLNAKQLLFVTNNQINIIPFEKIIGYEIVNLKENDQVLASATTTITKTDTGDMLKRAIIGGVLGGGVGALIGGATAKSTTSEVDPISPHMAAILALPNLELRIRFDDIINPMVKIGFDQYKDEVEKIAASLNVIIKRNADSTEDCASDVITAPFNLMDSGNKIGLAPRNPFAKYNVNTTDNSGGSSCLVMLTLIVSLIGLLGFAVSCI